jgi:hypothetical protein
MLKMSVIEFQNKINFATPISRRKRINATGFYTKYFLAPSKLTRVHSQVPVLPPRFAGRIGTLCFARFLAVNSTRENYFGPEITEIVGQTSTKS